MKCKIIHVNNRTTAYYVETDSVEGAKLIAEDLSEEELKELSYCAEDLHSECSFEAEKAKD